MPIMILVTGGTGYLGGRLVRALCEAGQKVVVLVRPKADTSSLPASVELRQGDLIQPESLKSAMAGCTFVFHTAACVKTWSRDPTLFDQVNVAGTFNVLEAASQAGIQRIIYTSSFFALGPTGPDPVNEARPHPGPPFRTDYERTKYAAAQLVRSYASKIPVVSLLPGMIYGPGAMTQGNFVSVLVRDFLRRKMPGVIGDGSQRWTFAYINDVVAGHLAALDRGQAGAQYILGGPVVSMRALLDLLTKITGVPAPTRRIPFSLAKAAGAVQEALAWGFGMPPQLTRQVVEVYKHHWAYSCAKAEAELGYTSRSLEAGLRTVVEWLRDAHNHAKIA